MRPNDLPLPIAPFVRIRVPMATKGDVTVGCDDFDIRLVPNGSGIVVEMNIDVRWFPYQVPST